jgi:phosphoglycerol transferase MdoB-like AlkP superfamily enzyme
MVSSLLTKTCPLSKVAPLRSWKVLIIIVAVAAVNFAVFHLALAPDTSATASTQPLEILVWWTNMNWAAFGKTHVPLPNYIGTRTC